MTTVSVAVSVPSSTVSSNVTATRAPGPTSGAVKLQCVRHIHWDLQMEYFNGTGLTPQEIRSMLESR